MKLLLMIFLVFGGTKITGQVTNAYKIKDSCNVEEIVEYNWTSNKDGTKKSKLIIRLNKNGQVVQKQFYDEAGSRKKDVINEYDSGGKLLKTEAITKEEEWLKYPEILISKYVYKDSKFISIEFSDSQDSILWIKKMKYNEHGDVVAITYDPVPEYLKVMMAEFDRDSIAYDYKNNTKTTFALDASGALYMSETSSINPVRVKDAVYDDFGNIIRVTNIEYLYEYDEKGNWINKQKFQIKKDGTKEFLNEHKRKITYRKQDYHAE